MTANFFRTKGSVLDVDEMLCCAPAGKEEVEMSIEYARPWKINRDTKRKYRSGRVKNKGKIEK